MLASCCPVNHMPSIFLADDHCHETEKLCLDSMGANSRRRGWAGWYRPVQLALVWQRQEGLHKIEVNLGYTEKTGSKPRTNIKTKPSKISRREKNLSQSISNKGFFSLGSAEKSLELLPRAP